MSQRDSGYKRKKDCKRCGATFVRRPGYSDVQWQGQKFCSHDCAVKARATHGLRHTRLYGIWANIKQRCTNPNTKLYQDYGARGITLCPEWLDDFAAFAAHMKHDPGEGWDIGRINNDLGYAPGNVEWQTEKQNGRNRRDTFWVDYQGERMSLSAAAELAGVPRKLVWQRIKRNGWTVEEALR